MGITELKEEAEMEKCDFYLSQETIDKLLMRLSRIEGQVRGIQKMIKEGRNCDDILVQISAVKSALNSVAIKLLEDHIESCVKPAVESGDIKSLESFLETVKKLIKGGC